MKKNIVLNLLLTLPIGVFAQHQNHQLQADTSKIAVKPKSPKMTAMAMVSTNHVHIEYGSPSVRGRNIWNGLVAYNQVWSSGAHKATWIDFGQDVLVEGKVITKGKYGFFTIPGKETWTLILSKTWDMHLADDYKEDNDIIRIMVKPTKNDKLVESLAYEVLQTNAKEGKIKLSWEYLSVEFPFKNK
jgi:hypothetical protein